MIGIWFKEDIKRILAEHRYVVVTDACGDGEYLLIPGFGVFESKYRPAHSGRNPRTKELVEIPAHTTPVFKAGKEFKDKVNK